MWDFRDIQVWQQSHERTLGGYKVTSAAPRVRRASASIPSHRAEGCGRTTQGSELEDPRRLAREAGCMDREICLEIGHPVSEIRRRLSVLGKTVSANKKA